jgi:broad specificity phosphatase PhoE
MGAIYLVRHGQASFGSADYDQLSGRGYAHSTVAGAELRRRGVTFSEARTGSLARQRDTAAAALAELDGALVAKEDARWNEYDHVDIAAHHAGGAEQGGDSRAYQATLDGALAKWVEAGDDGPCAELGRPSAHAYAARWKTSPPRWERGSMPSYSPLAG